MSRLNKKGFTLIELLVVIAIIGILASIVIVSLNSARNKAYRASALSTVSALGTEFIMCSDDSQYLNPPTSATLGGGEICTDSGGTAVVGHTVTWPSLDNTNGYCYSSSNSSCSTPIFTNQSASSALTLYLYNANNVLITCSWDGSAGYTCS